MAEANHMFLLELSNALPPGFNFKDLLDEIARADIPYRRHYSEYQSGGWWTSSLLGRTADATDGAVTDTGRPVETDALDRLPLTRRFLEDLGLRYMMVRLARLDPGGALWEHRDYQDLSRASRQRIHLPTRHQSRRPVRFRGLPFSHEVRFVADLSSNHCARRLQRGQPRSPTSYDRRS